MATAAAPTAELTANSANAALGSDGGANLAFTATPAGGTVDFYACEPSEVAGGACPTGVGTGFADEVPVAANVPSGPKTFSRAGLWCFRAVYNGDGVSDPGEYFGGTGGAACTTVAKGDLGVAWAIDDATLAMGEATRAHLTVTGVAGAVDPTGIVKFFVCSPSQVDGDGECGAGGAGITEIPVEVGTWDSDPFVPSQAGTWCLRAEYAGDANYNAAVAHPTNACVVVGKGTPTATLTPDDASILAGAAQSLDVQIHRFGPGPVPTGAVTFYLCAPANVVSNACPAGGTADGPRALAAGAATSAVSNPTTLGRWCYRVEYAGDGNYDAATFAPANAGCFRVVSPPTLGLSVDPVSLPLGDTFTATFTASGSPTPTGPVTFFLCGPLPSNTAGCADGGTATAPVALAAGSATSPAFVPTSGGKWCVRAAYAGDDGYLAGTIAGVAGCATVTSGGALVTLDSSTPAPALGAAWSVVADVAGPAAAALPTGTVTYTYCKLAIGTGDCPAGSATDSSAIGADGLADEPAKGPFVPTSAGRWCAKAAYSGDANYAATSVHLTCVSVAKGTPPISALAPSLAAAGLPVPVGAVVRPMPTILSAWAPFFPVPTGTLAFSACEGICDSTAPTFASLSLGGGVAAAAYTPALPGNSCTRAAYAGDANYLAAVANACTTVVPLPPVTIAYTPATPHAGDLISVQVTMPETDPPAGGTVEIFVCSEAQLDGAGECATGGSLLATINLATAADGPLSFGPFVAPAGKRCVRLVYSGDATNPPLELHPALACVTIDKSVPTVTLSALAGAVTTLGGTIPVAVTVGGAGPTPTGHVKLFACPAAKAVGEVCVPAFLSGGEGDLTSGSVVLSSPTLTSGGEWCFRADYGGDGIWAPRSTIAKALCLSVPKSEIVHPGSVDARTADGGDAAALGVILPHPENAPAPSGGVIFRECARADVSLPGCTAWGAEIGRATLDAAGAAGLDWTFPGGDRCWGVQYEGDPNYAAKDLVLGCFTDVVPAELRIVGSPSKAEALAAGDIDLEATIKVPQLQATFLPFPARTVLVVWGCADPECDERSGPLAGIIWCDPPVRCQDEPKFGIHAEGAAYDIARSRLSFTLPYTTTSPECFRVDAIRIVTPMTVRFSTALGTVPIPTPFWRAGGSTVACPVLPKTAVHVESFGLDREFRVGVPVELAARIFGTDGQNPDGKDVTSWSGYPRPTGTIKVFLCSAAQESVDGRCPTGGSEVRSVSLADVAGPFDGSLLPAEARTATFTFTPETAGRWCGRLEYSGDAVYAAGAAAPACKLVVNADGTISTAAGTPGVGLGALVAGLAAAAVALTRRR